MELECMLGRLMLQAMGYGYAVPWAKSAAT